MDLTSKCPPLLIIGSEQTTMRVRMEMRATPVGLAQPGIRPNTWGLAVKIHS